MFFSREHRKCDSRDYSDEGKDRNFEAEIAGSLGKAEKGVNKLS